MRKIRKHITTIILAVLAVIAGVYAYNYHDMKQNIVYNEHLEDVAVNVNGKELTLRDMAFYVAYEEMNVEKQALVYDSDNQTSIGISTQTVNLSVLQRAKQLCPWPFTMRFFMRWPKKRALHLLTTRKQL